MTDDAISVLNCLFQTIWSLFNSWCIPGTNVTPAGFFLFLISAGVGLRYAILVLNRPDNVMNLANSFKSAPAKGGKTK